LDSEVLKFIHHGFGIANDSEDRFDAFIGLYGMINIVQGYHASGEPLLPHISTIEGWIIGQESLGGELGVSRVF
jgi:hypothetical protein